MLLTVVWISFLINIYIITINKYTEEKKKRRVT